jgi:predicted molibdopterin-dependent oxidoreductase YjgC
MVHKCNKTLKIKSYYHFLKAVNYYLVSNGFENSLFIKDRCEGYEKYKKALLKENFMELVEKSGVKFMDEIIEFAKEFNNEMNAVIIYSEKELCSQGALEVKNLAMVTGKLGKTSNGLIALKEKNNSQGLFDMGICPKLGVGSQKIGNNELQEKMRQVWGVDKLPKKVYESQYNSFETGKLKNIFIFGEDPMGCAINKVKVAGWLSVTDFVVVQDYFMTDTAEKADLILPASMPFEIGGSFTNTQKMIQEFDVTLDSKIEKTSYDQLIALGKKFGIKTKASPNNIMMEAIKLFPEKPTEDKLNFEYTDNAKCNMLFNHGCDVLVKQFEEDFEKRLKN